MEQSTLRRLLGYKENLHWLKIDLNAAEIITVEDYIHKKKCDWTYTYTVLKLRVKQVADESKIWQHKNDKAERKSTRDLKNLYILLENSAAGLGLGESTAGVMYLFVRIHLKSCCIFLLKVATALLSGSRKGAVGA